MEDVKKYVQRYKEVIADMKRGTIYTLPKGKLEILYREGIYILRGKEGLDLSMFPPVLSNETLDKLKPKKVKK